jgi:enamine deaminase RidA (YjgF/YER057c/UK114 family)
MFTHHSPATIMPPASAYSHGVGVPANARWLHISGQIGVNPDGTLAGDGVAQLQACWRNIFAILADADMAKKNIVKITAYITDAELVGAYRETRDQNLDGHLCAATLVVVSALAHPDWVAEIEAVAAA